MLQSPRDALLSALTIAFAAVCSCVSNPRASDAPSALVRRYEPAAWRLNPERLAGRLVRLSHIVVTHRKSQRLRSTLPWLAAPPATRSRDEAGDLATRVYAAISAGELTFREAAQLHSDDPATRDLGGSLGNVSAEELSGYYLDALFATPTGSVSSVFQSPAGFHIILNEAYEPETVVSAEALAFGYRRSEDQQSRASAYALARQAAALWKDDPTAGTVLFSAFPEGLASFGGQLGEVSSFDPYYPSVVAEALSRLSDGEVSSIIDTAKGFVVVRRAPRPSTAQILAATTVVFRPLTSLTLLGSRRGAPVALAALLRDEWATMTQQSEDEFLQYYCRLGACSFATHRWTVGQNDDDLDSALLRTAVGEVVARPIVTEQGIVVARRNEVLATQSDLHPRSIPGLPEYTYRTLDELLELVEKDDLLSDARALMGELARSLRLGDDERTQFVKAFEQAMAALESLPVENRRAVVADLDRNVREILGDKLFEDFKNLRERWIRRRQLGYY